MNSFAQTAFVKGIVLDGKNLPIEGVNVSCPNNTAQTNEKGFYQIAIPPNQIIIVEFTHISLKKASSCSARLL